MTCNSNAGLLLRVAGLSLFVLLLPAVALAAGVGGSMLSIGSAAGVAVPLRAAAFAWRAGELHPLRHRMRVLRTSSRVRAR